MTLAAGSSLDSLIYIAAAVWGIISWWRSKTENSVEPGPSQAPPARRPTPPQPAQTDEERTRRFLEALGVPTAPQPRPAKPRPMPKTLIRPKPPIRPKPRPIPVQESEEIPLAGRLEEPASAIEAISAEFDQLARGIVLQALPETTTKADVEAIAEIKGDDRTQPGAVTGVSIQAILRSPDSLRTAFVLREVLGRPRSEAI